MAALSDHDPQETKEWMEAFEAVLEFEGAERANYLLDALQVVEARTGKLVRQIPLGGPAQASLARQGEANRARRFATAKFRCFAQFLRLAVE